MNHPLEKMKISEMNHHKKKMERRAMIFQIEKKMIIEKTKMMMMMAMMGKIEIMLLSVAKLSLYMKLIQMEMKEMN